MCVNMVYSYKYIYIFLMSEEEACGDSGEGNLKRKKPQEEPDSKPRDLRPRLHPIA